MTRMLHDLDIARMAWAEFRKAYIRIRQEFNRNQSTGSQDALARADGLETAMDELHEAFQHIHVRSDDGDKCALCDLDLRNDIHIRSK